MQKTQQEDFYMENWISGLQDITIPLKMFPLSTEEVMLLIKINGILIPLYFAQLKQHQIATKGAQQAQEEEFIPLGQQNWLERPELKILLASHHTLFNDLISRIEAHMEKNEFYFAKLSLRSAKDSLSLKKTERRFEKVLNQIGCQNSREESFRLGLIVNDSRQIIQQLVTSQRIVDDISRHLQLLKKKPTLQPLHLVLRPWLLIPHSLQFRAFVCNRQLTAISAYYKSELYPFLSPQKQAIQSSIQSFFDLQLKEKLPFDSCVLDIGLALNSQQLYASEKEIIRHLQHKTYQVILIEINPFGKVSGSALFSWLQPILTKGPLQFRLAHQQTFF